MIAMKALLRGAAALVASAASASAAVAAIGGGCAQVVGIEGATLLDAGVVGACAPGSKTSCYTGPKGTEGVGICKAGTATCNEDGTAYGTCEDEKTPQPKSCASTMDLGCDKLPCVEWAHAYGGGTFMPPVALDPTDGSMVVLGQFTGTLQFGSITVKSTDASTSAMLVARISAGGTPVWAKAFPQSSPGAVAVDKSGAVYVGGASAPGTTIAGTPLGNGQFVMKLDKGGTPKWANFLGGPLKGTFCCATPSRLHIAQDGDLLVLGSFQTPINFGDGAVQPTGSGSGYLAKLDSMTGKGTMASTGTRWAQIVDAPAFGLGGIGVDGMGNVYLGMGFNGSLDFSGVPQGTSASSSGMDLAVVGFQPNGQPGGLFHVGNDGSQAVWDLAVDSSGTVTLAGQMQGTLTFMNAAGSPTTLSATSAAGDGFVIHLEEAMTYTWGRVFGTSGVAMRVGLDAKGDVRALGWFSGTLDLGAGKLYAASNEMLLLADLSGADGSVKWNRGWIYPEMVSATLAVAPAGDSFVAGLANGGGSLELGTGPLQGGWEARFAP